MIVQGKRYEFIVCTRMPCGSTLYYAGNGEYTDDTAKAWRFRHLPVAKLQAQICSDAFGWNHEAGWFDAVAQS